jgi:hypothetical protein
VSADWTVVVPVKGTSAAKSRLGASPDVAMAIALDTVEAASGAARVVVVAPPHARAGFVALGASVVDDEGDGLRRRLDPDRGEAGVGHPAHDRARDDGRDADDGGGCRGERVADARDRDHRADRHDRVGRGVKDEVRRGDRVEHAGRGGGGLDVVLHERAGRKGRPVLRPPFLEVQLRPVVDHDMGLHLVVGRGDESHPEVPAGGDAVGHGAESHARPQQVGAREVRADVEVAEGEPRPADTVGAQLSAHPLGLTDPAPSTGLVVLARERVHDRVEVGGDPQAREPHVVTRVDDRRDFGAVPAGARRLRRHVLAESAQEACATDAARQYCDPHSAYDSCSHPNIGGSAIGGANSQR